MTNITDREASSKYNPNEIWRKMKEALEKVARKYDHKLEQKPNKQWISDATGEMIRNRQRIKTRRPTQAGDRQEHLTLTKEINKVLRKEKQKPLRCNYL